jgi:hypothetical protein
MAGMGDMVTGGGNGLGAGGPSLGGFQGMPTGQPSMPTREGGKSDAGQMAMMKQLYMMARMKAAQQAIKNKQILKNTPYQSGNIAFQDAMNLGKPSMANVNKWATAGNPMFANTWGQPNQIMPPTADGRVNPWGLNDEQITWALSGDPQAIRRLSDSLGATGGQDPRLGTMTPENQKFHQIVNWYEAGGGGFNGGGYTAQDAFNAQKKINPDMFKPMNFQAGTPVYKDWQAVQAGTPVGTATGVGQYYNQP